MEGEGREGGKDWQASKEGPNAKTIVAIVAILLVAVFGLQNMDGADIDLLFWDVDVPLWIVIAVSALLGFVIGWLLGRASGRRRAIERLTD
jgi:uncharacterized integral membrane protein